MIALAESLVLVHIAVMLWLALLAQVAAPTPVGPDIRFRERDAPEGSYEAGEPIVVKYAVSVAPDGRAYDCRIEVGSGNRDLDSKTCQIATRKVAYHPATDASGRAVHGVYRNDANWWMGEGAAKALAIPQAQFTVNKLPSGVVAPVLLDLALTIEANGKTSGCSPAAGETQTSLAAIACGQMISQFGTDPLKSESGNVIASVQNATVAFRTK